MIRTVCTCALLLLPLATVTAAESEAPHGEMIMGVAMNRARVSSHYDVYARIELKVPGTKASLWFAPPGSRAVVGEVGGTALYYFDLPAGKYRVEKLLGSYAVGNAVYSEWLEVGENLPEITIEPGRLTDGGTLILQPIQGGAQVARIPSAPGQLAYARAALGATLKVDASAPLVAWSDGDDRARELLAQMQYNAVAIGRFFATRDGRALVPGKFGQLLRYEGEAKWSTRGTGMTGTLFSVNERREAGLVVGGEFGAIAFADGLFGPWTVDQLPDGAGAVYGVVETPSGELVALAGQGMRTRSTLAAMFSAPDSFVPAPSSYRIFKRSKEGVWSLLREISLPSASAPIAFAERDVLVVSVGKDKLGMWSAADGAWSELKLPGDGLMRATDGTWVTLDDGYGYYSRDRGASWTKLERGRMGKSEGVTTRVNFLGMPVPLAAPGHWVAAAYRPYQGPMKSSGLYKSADGGANWYREKLGEKVCVPTLQLASVGDMTFAVCELSQIYGRDTPEGEWKAREFVSPTN